MAESFMPGSSPGTSNRVMVRNIITGVVTTVVGATVIYFLGFYHKSGGSADFAVVKEATTNAWRFYVSAENVFYNNWKIAMANYYTTGFDHYKEVTLGELDRFKADLKKILNSKDLDPSLISLVERRLGAKQQWEDKYKKHLDKYENLIKTIADTAQRTPKLNEEVQRFQTETKDIDQRFANEIGEICKTLSDKYNTSFSWAELQMYQQLTNTTTNGNTNTSGNGKTGQNTVDWRMLVGKWVTSDGTNDLGTLHLNEDGRMFYYFRSGDSTYGRWQVNNNQLSLFYDQFWGAGQQFKYELSGVTENSFSMTLTDPPHSTVKVTRVN